MPEPPCCQVEASSRKVVLPYMHAQAALHVMAQRSAVLQIDLDQTADRLRKNMQDVVYQEILLLEAQTSCDQERYFRIMAEALVGTLTSKVELQQQELSAIESRVTECR